MKLLGNPDGKRVVPSSDVTGTIQAYLFPEEVDGILQQKVFLLEYSQAYSRLMATNTCNQPSEATRVLGGRIWIWHACNHSVDVLAHKYLSNAPSYGLAMKLETFSDIPRAYRLTFEVSDPDTVLFVGNYRHLLMKAAQDEISDHFVLLRNAVLYAEHNYEIFLEAMTGCGK